MFLKTLKTTSGLWTRLLKTGLKRITAYVPLIGLRMTTTSARHFLIRYFGLGLLYVGRPFTKIGDWFWKKHRAVLDLLNPNS
ncbi:MAG: hypothetical protein CM15mV47_600 [uncultured marine virus]|nr:MAG: hypothetical protein CM15mV47_600 [uncultured marine virus]